MPEALHCLQTEALEKVQTGLARLVAWDDIKACPPPNLKISPLVAVPHKSRRFRAILDLSFQLRMGGIRLPSVNAATRKHAYTAAMHQLGNVLPRLIAAMAAAIPDHGPIFFAKWDIKDGFWRMLISEHDAWNFAYLLPAQPGEPVQLVIPTSLQMGWCESPPFFCSATETARDVAQQMINDTTTALPEHPLECLCLPAPEILPPIQSHMMPNLVKLLEVYVDDFIGMIQSPTKEQLQHFTRALLHAIHSIFPPASITKVPHDEPVALKKLNNGDGMWATSKEILGWVFDGINRCISLPPEKVDSLRRELRRLMTCKSATLRELQRLQGRLIHTSYGLPNGKALLSPLVALIAKQPPHRHLRITLDPATQQACRDWRAMLKTAAAQPTPCADLMPAPADYLGYCDASKQGAGGVWFGGIQHLPPIVWRIAFPPLLRLC